MKTIFRTAVIATLVVAGICKAILELAKHAKIDWEDLGGSVRG